MSNDTVSSRLSVRFTDLISRTAQFLCREGRFGTWGTTRTSGTAIWALAECGLTHSHKDFLLYCIRQLLSSDDFLRDENGSRFNDEGKKGQSKKNINNIRSRDRCWEIPNSSDRRGKRSGLQE
jgi:hypothetical protein